LFGWNMPVETGGAALPQAGPVAPQQMQALSGEGELQVVITYTYDSLNRLTNAIYSSGPNSPTLWMPPATG
jgi:hypothetical protein